jgi:hypothetical protein
VRRLLRAAVGLLALAACGSEPPEGLIIGPTTGSSADTCAAGAYAFASAPGCAAWCYGDEAHSVATTGSDLDRSGYASFARGQLSDGRRGGHAWDADNGFGPAQEWVGWIEGEPRVTLRLAPGCVVRRVRVGMNNSVQGGVKQPSVVRVATSADGTAFGATTTFALGDGSQAAIPAGQRGDVELPLLPREARLVRLSFVRTGWLMLDEIELE